MTLFSVLSPPCVAVVQPLHRPSVTCSVTKCSLLKFIKCPQAGVDLNTLYLLFYLSKQVSASSLPFFFSSLWDFYLSDHINIFTKIFGVTVQQVIGVNINKTYSGMMFQKATFIVPNIACSIHPAQLTADN